MADDFHTIRHYTVRFCDCDASGHIHLHRLMDYAQDCDDANCAFFEATTKMLRARDICWILIANKVKFLGAMPGADDTLIVESWSAGSRGVRLYRANRYYRDTVDEAHLFGTGFSEWILCSRSTHRPLRPFFVLDADAFNSRSDLMIDHVVDIPRLASFARSESIRSQVSYQVGYGDLDANNHLHNTHFARLALDAAARYLSIDPCLPRLRVQNFHIQFVKEANYLDALTVFATKDSDDPNRILIEGKITGQDESSFLAALDCDAASDATHA
ncbi:MAG TPA: acyl-CoA thioesterase [Clostridia bacterium]|nr:acyl-CoA thioesterase [Clostridia bacterium]